MSSPPKVNIFAPCDAAIRDRQTGKYTLVGVFDRIVASRFPADYGVYLKMRGLNGRYEFRVQIVAPDLQTVVTEIAFADPHEAGDPLATVEMAANFDAVVFSAPGRYTVRLVYNGRTAEELSLLVEGRS